MPPAESDRDLSWRPGKKSVGKHHSDDTGAGAAISGQSSDSSETPRTSGKRQVKKGGTGKQSPNDKKDLFDLRGNQGKKQLANGTFDSALRGAGGLSEKPDQWEARGSHTGKRQVHGSGNQSSLQGATADVPAAEIQKLRIGLVKNSQRFVTNFGPGLTVSDAATDSSGAKIQERARPERKHGGPGDFQLDHLAGARLSIHQKNRPQGRQVSSEVTNRSHFLAMGLADADHNAVSSRRLGKETQRSRVGKQGHLGRNNGLRPEAGSTSPTKRHLKPALERDMYSTTEQVSTRRGRKRVGAAPAPSVGGVIRRAPESDGRPAAGKPSSPRRTLTQSRGVGSQRVPRTPGGNSQIVFG